MFTHRCQREFSVHHPFCPYQPVSYILYICSLSFNNNDLKTGMLIEMDMQGRNYGFTEMMLQVCERIGEFSSVMRVNDADGPYGFPVAILPLLFYKTISDKVPDGLASVGITFFGYKAVKIL